MNLKDTVKLANGVEMPRLGFGVWKVQDGDEAVNSVKWAIEAGYISIDTALLTKMKKALDKRLKSLELREKTYS